MDAESYANSLYIGGEWAPAASGMKFPVRDPATGAVVAEVADGGADDARRAVAAAGGALEAWSSLTAYDRSDLLLTAHRLLLERADDLAVLMTTEQGKPIRAARIEVRYASDFMSWFAEEAKRLYGRTIPSSRRDQRFMVQHQAVGVVGAITPWNYPVSMITRKIAPALAAGCTVVLKPAEQTPLCAVEVFRVFHDAGVPAGVLNLVTASDPEPIGEELLTNRTVRKITFTGSTTVGKHLARESVNQMKRVSLELGGHAPFLVMDDADPVHAAKGAAAVKMLNTGQACISPNRIYVQRALHDQFVETLTQRVQAMRVGHGIADGVSVGPLIDEAALARMQRQVDDAAAQGAHIHTGGSRLQEGELGSGFFYAPTVLSGVKRGMQIYQEETFGPVAAVTVFDDEDEAIAMANDTDYGLASYVYTRDLSRAIRISEALHFGMVGVNDINPTSAAAPFGGVRESGLGREGALEGIFEYVDTKLVGISVAGSS